MPLKGSYNLLHDRAVTVLSKTNELVVLADDVGCSLGEVESEGSLVSTEVVDVENEFLWQELWITPDNPSDTRVDLPMVLAVALNL